MAEVHPEDEGSKVLQNIGTLLHHYMVSELERLQFEWQKI